MGCFRLPFQGEKDEIIDMAVFRRGFNLLTSNILTCFSVNFAVEMYTKIHFDYKNNIFGRASVF